MTPRSYVVPEHLAVTPDVAPVVAALLRAGRMSARADGAPLPDRVVVWLRDLDAMTGPSVSAETDVVVRWIPTCEVASMLGISERAVRKLRLKSKKSAGNLLWLEADVLAEVDARAK